MSLQRSRNMRRSLLAKRVRWKGGEYVVIDVRCAGITTVAYLVSPSDLYTDFTQCAFVPITDLTFPEEAND